MATFYIDYENGNDANDGTSWANAWATITSGATAARIAPGDVIRIAKSPDGVSVGSTDFTSGAYPLISTPAVKNIATFLSGSPGAAETWTYEANVSLGTSTTRPAGSTSIGVSIGTSFTTGKVAYYDLGSEVDLSGFEQIAFWFLATASFGAGVLDLRLCSDTTGDTVVNTISIPAVLSSGRLQPVIVDNGAALGSNIRSLSIYANSDPSTVTVCLLNIVATNGLYHGCLFGKSTSDLHPIAWLEDTGSATRVYYGMNSTGGNVATYPGATATVTGYYWTPFILASGTTFETLAEAGSSDAPITYSAGWDTSTTEQNGISHIHPVGANTFLSANRKHIVVERFYMNVGPGGSSVVYLTSSLGGHQVYSACGMFNGSACISNTQAAYVDLIDCVCSGFSSTLSNESGFFQGCLIANGRSSSGSIGITPGMIFLSCRFEGHSRVFNSNTVLTSAMPNSYPVVRNSVFLNITNNLLQVTSGNAAVVAINDYNQTAGDNRMYFESGEAVWQTTEKQGSDPGAWSVYFSSSFRAERLPLPFMVAQAVVESGSLVTVTAWVKKSHATNVGARLIVRGNGWDLPGISETSDTKANDTDWEQLTVSFTPTRTGVVPVWVDCWYIAGVGYIYIGSISITQA